ncbi:hypothetical protein EJB05_18628, partial [Eragrostis curvula]
MPDKRQSIQLRKKGGKKGGNGQKKGDEDQKGVKKGEEDQKEASLKEKKRGKEPGGKEKGSSTKAKQELEKERVIQGAVKQLQKKSSESKIKVAYADYSSHTIDGQSIGKSCEAKNHHIADDDKSRARLLRQQERWREEALKEAQERILKNRQTKVEVLGEAGMAKVTHDSIGRYKLVIGNTCYRKNNCVLHKLASINSPKLRVRITFVRRRSINGSLSHGLFFRRDEAIDGLLQPFWVIKFQGLFRFVSAVPDGILWLGHFMYHRLSYRSDSEGWIMHPLALVARRR